MYTPTVPRARGAYGPRGIPAALITPLVVPEPAGGWRPWQQDLLTDLQDPTYRTALVGLPRKNGKSALAAYLGLTHLLSTEEAHVMSVGPTEAQARIVWETAYRLVGKSPELDAHIQRYHNRMLIPSTGAKWSVHTIAPAGAAGHAEERLQGFRPTLALCDEIHVYREREPWDAIVASMGSAEAPLCLGITTAGSNEASFAYELYAQGRAGAEGMYFKWWEPAGGPDVDHLDERIWAEVNPAINDFLHLDAVRHEARTMPEHAFRRYRLNQWTKVAEAWLPVGVWAGAASPRPVPPGSRVYLAFDGSLSRDSTALVACTDQGYVFVLGHWEPGKGSRVSKAAVHRAVADAFRIYRVKSMWADPPYWWEDVKEWQQRYGESRVLEISTNVRQRMAKACAAFYAGLGEGRLAHDGHPALASHLANCTVKPTAWGDLIVKETKDSPRKIDLAVAAVLAYAQHAENKRPHPQIMTMSGRI